MAGIEDYVVEQIIADFQQQQPEQAPAMQQPMQEPQQYAQAQPPQPAQPQRNIRMNGVDFSQQEFDRYLQTPLPGQQDIPLNQRRTVGSQATADYAGQEKERVGALNKRDAARATIMEGLRGLDPQIQSTILKRLGIDPGAVKSQLQQQKELATFKQGLEQPQLDTANAIKMLLATQGGQQNAAEFALKQQSQQQEQASRGQTQNIQLMRVLATLMQSDASGQLTKTLGPLLMQMLQGSGINLAPSQPAGGERAGRAGIKITRE